MFSRKHDTIGDKAEQVIDEARENLHEFGREAHQQAKQAKSEMVKTLYDAAKTLRKQAREADTSKDVRERVDDVAVGFEKAATYLKRNSYGDMGDDAVKTVRSYPLQTMAVILIIGVIIGLILRDNRPHYDKLVDRAYHSGDKL